MNKTPFWKKIKIKELFKRKPNRFIELLVQQATTTEEGMKALITYFEKPNKRHAKEVDNIEGAADEIRRILIDEFKSYLCYTLRPGRYPRPLARHR